MKRRVIFSMVVWMVFLLTQGIKAEPIRSPSFQDWGEYQYRTFLPVAMKEFPLTPPSVSSLKGVGLGWSFYGSQDLGDIKSLGVTKVFNWGFNPQFYDLFAEQKIEYFPLISGVEENPLSDEEVREFFAQHPEALLFLFNEPEWQNRLSPEEAVVVFDHYLDLVGPNRIIVGNVIALDDLWNWLEGKDGEKGFVAEYKATHDGQLPPVLGYGGHSFYEDCVYLGRCPANWSAPAYESWLQGFVDKVHSWDPNAQVWFTEFGTLYPGDVPVEKVMQIGVQWFESHSHPYFWFATRSDGPGCNKCCCSLLNYPDGGLSDLGWRYRELP